MAVKVEWLEKEPNYISQVYSTGLEMSLLSSDNKQVCPFVFCKDFLQDVIQAHLHNKKNSIYGFEYDPEKMAKPDMNKTRIIMGDSKNSKIVEKAKGAIEFVNHFAYLLRIKSTELLEIENSHRKFQVTILTEGSKVWMNAPPLLSLYTLLLRAGMNHTLGSDPAKTYEDMIKGKIKPYGKSDYEQLNSSKEGVTKLIKLGYRKFFYIDSAKNYPKDTAVHTMHNECGIVAMTKGCYASVSPYSNREKIQKLLKSS